LRHGKLAKFATCRFLFKDKMADLNKLIDSLKNSEKILRSHLVGAVGLTLSSLQRFVEVYPPQPDRNRAKTFNTYVRGVGNYPKSSFIANPKAPGGYKVKLTPKGQIKMTSQQMNKGFRQTVMVRDNTIAGTLFNQATYSGWVLGSIDQAMTPHQVPWHTETGWVAKETGMTEVEDDLNRNVEAALDKWWDSF
jgi:hypothetical protein